MKKAGDVFEMLGKKFEFIRLGKDSEGKFAECYELGINGERKFKVKIRPDSK